MHVMVLYVMMLAVCQNTYTNSDCDTDCESESESESESQSERERESKRARKKGYCSTYRVLVCVCVCVCVVTLITKRTMINSPEHKIYLLTSSALFMVQATFSSAAINCTRHRRRRKT